MIHSTAQRLRKGFTLIEVMVATAIMIVIILAVVTIASDTFKAYDKAVADLTSQSEARGVLDALEADLQSAVIRPDGRCWMEVIIPGTPKAPNPLNSTRVVVGNVNDIDQPILLFFAAPSNRPRWSPLSTNPRSALKGEVCAIAYRLGQSSPFDTPGDPIQRVYGLYRTIIDPESTFKEAIPEILFENKNSTSLVATTDSSSNFKSPISYWAMAPRTFANYSDGKMDSQVLINNAVSTTGTSFTPCWTLDQSNFLGSNVVSMSLVFWCSSSLPPETGVKFDGAFYDPLSRPAEMLRPIIAESSNSDAQRFVNGYPSIYTASGTKMTNSNRAPLRWARDGNNVPAMASQTPHPFDAFGSRLLVCADKIYTDGGTPRDPSTSTALKYLPYKLKAVEVSITILTPEGSKELRSLQFMSGQKTDSGVKISDGDFKRIVSQYGRNYTRYIRLLGNGG